MTPTSTMRALSVTYPLNFRSGNNSRSSTMLIEQSNTILASYLQSLCSRNCEILKKKEIQKKTKKLSEYALKSKG